MRKADKMGTTRATSVGKDVPGTVPAVANTGRDALLAQIEALAADHRGKRSIAATLGLSRRAFDALLAEDEEVLLALERGDARAEQEIADKLVALARAGGVVANLFLAKARFGWVEGQARDPERPRVTINLPDALTPGAYRVRDRNRYPDPHPRTQIGGRGTA